MKVILVDDEKNALTLFKRKCAGIFGIKIVASFTRPDEALIYVRDNPVDIAVLDVEMPEINGIELGKRLKELHKQIVLIYISAYDAYAIEAYRLHAPVYLEKPYSNEDIRFAFATAEKLVIQNNKAQPLEKKIFVRTFGYFDVFVDGELVHFRNKKSKELLALLVDRRGSAVNNEQAITILWEDSINDINYQSKLRRAVKDLKDTLQEAGIADILKNWYNSRAVDPKMFLSDYYWFLDGDPPFGDMFMGEYMCEYSWAEETVAKLSQLAYKRLED